MLWITRKYASVRRRARLERCTRSIYFFSSPAFPSSLALLGNSHRPYPTVPQDSRGLEAQYLPSENLHATLCAKLTPAARYNIRSAREPRRFRTIVAGCRNKWDSREKRAEWTEWLLVVWNYLRFFRMTIHTVAKQGIFINFLLYELIIHNNLQLAGDVMLLFTL